MPRVVKYFPPGCKSQDSVSSNSVNPACTSMARTVAAVWLAVGEHAIKSNS